MTRHTALLRTLGVAATLNAGLAGIAAAQGTSSSQQRIPISGKDQTSPGEVVPPKVDTVTMYRTDTTRIFSTDTVKVNVTVPGPVTTVTRIDTVTLQPILAAPINKGGLYFGVGMGGSLPFGSLQSVNNPAVDAQIQVGWQGLSNLIGVRADVNYASYSDAADYANMGPHPDVYNGNLDLKLQVPYLTHLFGYAPRFTVYALGGGSFSDYRNLRVSLDQSQAGIGPQNAAFPNSGWQSNFGWNAGAGVSFHWRSTEIFAESRMISFNPDNASAARQIPIVLGMDWY